MLQQYIPHVLLPLWILEQLILSVMDLAKDGLSVHLYRVQCST